MPAAKIVWDTEPDESRARPFYTGRIGELQIAYIMPRPGATTWWVHMYVGPLPKKLDRLQDTDKTSMDSAKRTAQRILNEYTDFLATGLTKKERT